MADRKEPYAPSGAVPELFDQLMAGMVGRPDVVSTKPSTKQVIPAMGIGGVQTFIVRTFRAQHEDGPSQDTIFLESYGAQGHVRLVLPAAICDVIARQRDSLTDKSRSRAAKRIAEDRAARGEVPGFLRKAK